MCGRSGISPFVLLCYVQGSVSPWWSPTGSVAVLPSSSSGECHGSLRSVGVRPPKQEVHFVHQGGSNVLLDLPVVPRPFVDVEVISGISIGISSGELVEQRSLAPHYFVASASDKRVSVTRASFPVS